MAKSSYTPDRAGFREMATSSGMQAEMVAAANRGKAYAESIAPVEEGEYRASFRVRPIIDGTGAKARAGAILENTSDHAFEVEYTNDDHILQRSIDHIERG